MKVVKQSVDASEVPESASRIALKVDRIKLLKRRWRGQAEDGTEFGFELDRPLTHGASFFVESDHAYCIEQTPEPVLEVDFSERLLNGLHVAWSIGNLHMPMQALPAGVRVADDPAVRQLFAHLDVSFREGMAVFEPIRSSTDIGHAHHHDHSHSH